MWKRVSAGGVLALCLWVAPAVSASERPSTNDATREAALDGVCAEHDGRLPATITLPRQLMTRVRTMLERSATFRRQCRRLAEASWVHVIVRIEAGAVERPSYRASTVIQRPQPRLVVAVVTLQALTEPALWISHEFEHLLEQVDDVDLRQLARRGSAAWPTGDHMFESGRAIRAGETVLGELRAKPRDDNFVED